MTVTQNQSDCNLFRIWQLGPTTMPARVRKLTPEQRLEAGMRCLCGGASVEETASKYNICRSYVYVLRSAASHYLYEVCQRPEYPQLQLDRNFLNRLILSLSLECQASIESIQEVLKQCFHIGISTGTISSTINEYSRKAADINRQIDISRVRSIALDEIYQGETPVMTGVDLDSDYAFLMDSVPDRQKETWMLELMCLQDQGLDPDLCISDACGSILSAVPEVYEGINVQIDVFHSIRDLGIAVMSSVNHAEAALRELCDLESRCAGKHRRVKTWQKYLSQKAEIDQKLERADALEILLGWIKELVAFPGYTVEEVSVLIEWILDEMNHLAHEGSKLANAIRIFRQNLPRTLKYLEVMFANLHHLAAKEGFNQDLSQSLYLLRRYDRSHEIYWEKRQKLFREAGCSWNVFSEMEHNISSLVEHTKRASSLIENLNSRIRVTMNAKRTVPANYFSLLQFYINTRKFHRSQKPERVGKSPVELMTGNGMDFFESLGVGPSVIG
jgi:hypothetical protein